MMRVKYMQLYMRIDKDGDGIAELRRIHCIGSGCYVLKDEVVDHAAGLDRFWPAHRHREVKTIFVDGARTLKRMRPAPQGRGYRVRKRSNHVTVIVDVKENKN